MNQSHLLRPRLFRAISSSVLYDILSIVSTVFSTRWFLSYLGESDYGLLIVISAAMGYLALLDLGLNQTISKYVAEYAALNDERSLQETISTSLALYTTLGLCAVLLSVVASYWISDILFLSPSRAPTAQMLLLMAAIKLGIGLPLSTFGGICFGLGYVGIYNLGRLTSVVSYIAIVYFSISAELSIVQIEAISIACPILGGALCWAAVARLKPTLSLSLWSAWRIANRASVYKLFGFSVYFLINHVIVLLVFYTDNLVIAGALGTGMVTSYAITQRIIQAGMQATFKLSDSLYPTFSALSATSDHSALQSMYLMATRYSLAVACIAALLLSLYAPWIIDQWTGPSGFAGPLTLWTLAAIIVIHTPVHVASALIAASGQLRAITIFSIAEGLLNFGLSVWWVQQWGLWGVALGTAVSMLLTTALFVPKFALKISHISVVRYAGEGLIPGIILAAPALAIGTALFLYAPPTQPWHAAAQAASIFATAAATFFLRSKYQPRTPSAPASRP